LPHVAQGLDHRIEVFDLDIAELVIRDIDRAQQAQGNDDLALHVGLGRIGKHFQHQLVLRHRGQARRFDRNLKRRATLLVEANRRDHVLPDLLRHQLQGIANAAPILAVDDTDTAAATIVENQEVLLQAGKIRLGIRTLVQRKHQLEGFIHLHRVTIDADLNFSPRGRRPGASQQQREPQPYRQVPLHHDWPSASTPPRLRYW
jgi:hypothetical protein